MSFFGMGGKPANNDVSDKLKVEAATAELDMVTGMFNALVSTCHKKCINTNYYEGELNKNEGLCIDRCVAKYFEVNSTVGESMQKLGQNMAGRV